MALVMVGFNVSYGLPKEVNIVWGDRVYHQRLDNKNIPFRCFLCLQTGHLGWNCLSVSEADLEDDYDEIFDGVSRPEGVCDVGRVSIVPSYENLGFLLATSTLE